VHYCSCDHLPRPCIARGLCDVNSVRLGHAVKLLRETLGRAGRGNGARVLSSDEFEWLLKEKQVDEVIVTSIDRTRHRYIVAAMEAGCDVFARNRSALTPPSARRSSKPDNGPGAASG